MRDDIRAVKNARTVVETMNMAKQSDELESLKKKDTYRKERIIHLEKKLEKSQSNLKKRIVDLEKRLKKLDL